MKFVSRTKNYQGLVVTAINVTSAVILTLFILSNLMVSSYSKFILTTPQAATYSVHYPRVAIVFGGGVTPDKQPTDIIKNRLDTAAELYGKGVVDRILVSGDNRFVDYNEPQVMQRYLEDELLISSADIQQDNAGRSTYETCERAIKVFGLKEAVLVSQNSHLPRAIFLCRSFGLNAYGYPARADSIRLSQALRELGANLKAVFNVYVHGEKTILGAPITF
ncbi:MAG: YdcF family protein [bacterium]|nr:YdcF family protein [bacterium]